MNSCSPVACKSSEAITPSEPSMDAQYIVGRVTGYDAQLHHFTVEDDIHAGVADGLLVQPASGDLVACLLSEQGNFILQVLVQANAKALSITSAKPIKMSAPSISMAARDELELVSLNRFSLVGKHGVISAAGSLVACAEQLIQQVGQFMLSAKGLMRLSGRQQVITAEEDVRIDGKRINMG